MKEICCIKCGAHADFPDGLMEPYTCLSCQPEVISRPTIVANLKSDAGKTPRTDDFAGAVEDIEAWLKGMEQFKDSEIFQGRVALILQTAKKSRALELEVQRLTGEKKILQKEITLNNEAAQTWDRHALVADNFALKQSLATWQGISDELEQKLRKIHKHNSESNPVYFQQDGKPIEIVVDLGEAYQDSAMCEEIYEALSKYNAAKSERKE